MEYFKFSWTFLWDLQFKGVFILTFPLIILAMHFLKKGYKDLWVNAEVKPLITLILSLVVNMVLTALHILLFWFINSKHFAYIQHQFLFYLTCWFISVIISFIVCISTVKIMDIFYNFIINKFKKT